MGLIDNNSVSFRDPSFYTQKAKKEAELGRKLSRDEFIENYYSPIGGVSSMAQTGTSIFDPVLCETQYLWFSKQGDFVIDPFAGGSVRGIVAVELGRHYCGVDLREEQVEANRENAEICTDEQPTWVCGDSLHIDELAAGEYDFMLTCPPYGNLEKYSDDEADISNMSDEDFDRTYEQILAKTVSMLRNDRFASIVVGNYRDKDGYLRDLVWLTVRAMESAGARYYNDFIFVTPAGSLPIRCGKAFNSSRKNGKTHQYCLTFVKGDPKKATKRLGDVELPEMSQFVEEEE